MSELHGAAMHLAVVAIRVYLLVLLARWAGMGGDTMRLVGAARRGGCPNPSDARARWPSRRVPPST